MRQQIAVAQARGSAAFDCVAELDVPDPVEPAVGRGCAEGTGDGVPRAIRRGERRERRRASCAPGAFDAQRMAK